MEADAGKEGGGVMKPMFAGGILELDGEEPLAVPSLESDGAHGAAPPLLADLHPWSYAIAAVVGGRTRRPILRVTPRHIEMNVGRRVFLSADRQHQRALNARLGVRQIEAGPRRVGRFHAIAEHGDSLRTDGQALHDPSRLSRSR
jgi:hypothetical protein